MRSLPVLALVFGVALIIGCPLTPPPPSGCSSDADCATGETCTNGECMAPTTSCTSDADCATGETCTNGECVTATTGCTSDADCTQGETCTNGECTTTTITGDAAAGETYYTANGCGNCHGANAQGAFGPSLIGVTADEIYAKLSGAENHTGGTFTVTNQDAADLEAYFASL